MLSLLINSFFYFFLFLFFMLKPTNSSNDDFTFNGFNNANMSLDGVASINSNGLLELTNTIENVNGHAFHHVPLHFKSSPNKTNSFSTTFVFAIRSDLSDLSGHGFAFVISPTRNFSAALPSQFLGVFNSNNDGDPANHVFAVELDTILNPELKDINDNHIGIDINSLISNVSRSAGYYEDNTAGLFKNLTLRSGQPMQVWIDFDGDGMQLNVTLSLLGMTKPRKPLLSSALDLASLMLDSMYIGFSASAGPFHTYHYILGWSFKINGMAKALDYAKLPSVPLISNKGSSNSLAIWLSISLSTFMMLVISVIILIVRRRMKYAEIFEEWEREYGPHRFRYKELFKATKGFNEKELLGTGGFGRVYKGVLHTRKSEVAVKKVSHDSEQGMKEFVAEIVSIGQLRHRNLVQVLGYCRRKKELLLVYDFMPNSSLDKLLYTDHTKPTLNWALRHGIIKGVASGLLYLHEDWEKVVIHRDIKASNVLLDSDMNGRLGDFGLARLYDRGTDPKTTHVVGTMGYLAPELALTGKATTSSDVFAFGAFLLEVVCGKRPNEPHAQNLILVDWVLENWRHGSLIDTIDPTLRDDYCPLEVERVLKLGLLCSHPKVAARPSMRQVMQILDADVQFPPFLPNKLSVSTTLSLHQNVAFDTQLGNLDSSTESLSLIS